MIRLLTFCFSERIISSLAQGVAMNPKAPKILNEAVEALKNAGLTAVTEDDEGRVNSKKDETNVIDWLMAQPKFSGKVRPVGLRQFGDAIFTDDNGVDHYVNIKTSIGSSDNAFSKLGFLWAFTDLSIEDMPSKISNAKWFEMISKHKKETDRDYWFLSFDKSDMSKVMVRGVKQIQHWGKNPTNNLQIIWNKEHEVQPKNCNFEQAWKDVIVDGVLYCWEKYCEGMLNGIGYRKKYATA